MVMVGNSPRPRIEIKPLIKLAGLNGATQLGEAITPTQGPTATAGLGVVFQHFDLVTRLAQFVSRRHACQARSQDQYRRAFWRLAQLEIAGISRLTGKTQGAHGLVHRGRAGGVADPAQQRASCHFTLINHDDLAPNPASSG